MTLLRISCAACGIEFAVPEHWNNKRHESGADFWCPNGHCLTYGESAASKLRRERNRLKQQLAEKDDAIAHLERSRAATQGQVTKLKKRAKAGVCPCCNRTFQNLARHMQNKHPDFGPNKVEGEKMQAAE